MPGSYDFQVLATNSAGQTAVNMTLNVNFQGVFTGTYDGSIFLEIEFNEDGSLVVRVNDESNPQVGTGTWTLSDGNVLEGYQVFDGDDEFAVIGDLSISASAATYAGFYYIGVYEEGDRHSWVFETTLQ